MDLYIDCFSGISGDMTLGAFFDLGVSDRWLVSELSRMPLTDFEVRVTQVFQNGIQAKDVCVDAKDHHTHRDYTTIRGLIADAPYGERVKERSLAIFEKIAQAESRIHGCPVDRVHFHEVGGIDALVDIVGTALCLEFLDVRRITAAAVPMGSGFVQCDHGLLPVPAPATLAILNGIPCYGLAVEQEIVTPTGAAILSALCDSFGPMPEMTVGKVGYGAGKRDLGGRPNLLRLVTGTEVNDRIDTSDETTQVLEAAIDDMNPEIYGYLMERLFDDGALDVYWQPVQMKKNRPGVVVTVLCAPENASVLCDRIFSETTTLGVKSFFCQRKTLPRKKVEKKTAFGCIEVKEIMDVEGRLSYAPEFEVCQKVARDKKIPLKEVYDRVRRDISESC